MAKRIVIEGLPEDVRSEALNRLKERITELMPKFIALSCNSNESRILKDALGAYAALSENKKTVGPRQNATIWGCLADRSKDTILSKKYEKYVRQQNPALL